LQKKNEKLKNKLSKFQIPNLPKGFFIARRYSRGDNVARKKKLKKEFLKIPNPSTS